VTVFELARVMGTSVRMIEKHYGALLDGAHNVIASRLDVFEAEQVAAQAEEKYVAYASMRDDASAARSDRYGSSRVVMRFTQIYDQVSAAFCGRRTRWAGSRSLSRRSLFRSGW
jgi:hypothetical protein